MLGQPACGSAPAEPSGHSKDERGCAQHKGSEPAPERLEAGTGREGTLGTALICIAPGKNHIAFT